MIRRLALLVLIGAALLVDACGGGEKTIEVRHPVGYFGMNTQRLPLLLLSGQTERVDGDLARIHDLGVGFVRSTVDWRDVEPTAPQGGRRHFAFTTLDQWMELVSRNGLAWEPIVIGAPAPDWAIRADAGRSGCGALLRQPTGDYIAMLRAVARRYGRDGSFWADHPDLRPAPVTTYEIWNEANLSTFWCPRPDPAAYGRLYATARAALHAVDPRAVTLLGGLAPVTASQSSAQGVKTSFTTFLAQMVAADPDLKDAMDAIAFHPYGNTPDDVLHNIVAFRKQLTELGLGDVPVVANEYGWPTRGISPINPAVSEETRTTDLTQATELLAQSRCGLRGVAPHTWVSAERNPQSTVDWYGLADPSTGQPYPSGLAYGNTVRRLEQGESVASAAHCP